MKVGIVGAGLNSEYHINFAKAYPGAQVVGLVDVDGGRARERAEKHQIPGAYGTLEDLLERSSPDVVHVVTPPRTHFEVVSQVLRARRHALVEKPLALDGTAARALYDLAEENDVKLCPMHNHLFDPCMRRALAFVQSGGLGQVLNVESYYGLNTNIPAFRDYPRPNVLPWLYGLPGGVYQDFFPHPLYVLLEFTGAVRSLSLVQRSNGVLPQGLPDEIRILVEGERSPGIVTFSFGAQPFLHFIRIYGTKAVVEVDINTMTTVIHRVSSLPKAAQKATYNLSGSWQLASSTFTNVRQFLTGTLRPYQGMRTLMHEFYESIESGAAPPVSKESALRVVDTMDSVFDRLEIVPLHHQPIVPAAAAATPRAKRVLVTGGTGFLGKSVVKELIGRGYAVRVLARKLANVDALVHAGAEVFWGDVADLESFDLAFRDCDLIIHLAAGTSGSEKDSELGTLQGTRNVIELCRRHGARRLVYISSCSVYGISDCRKHATLGESAPLERFPERRGTYSASKQQAERYVTESMPTLSTSVVLLRPGTIYGPGGDLYTPMLGFRFGRTFAVIGMGGFRLPFVHVDNLVSAIVLAAERDEAAGEIFNVVDPEPLTKREYMEKVIRQIQPKAVIVYVPYAALYAITWAQELAFGLMKRRPVLTRYRLTSSQRPIVYDSSKLMTRLGWTPRVPQREALEQLAAFHTRGSAAEAPPPRAAELARSGAQ